MSRPVNVAIVGSLGYTGIELIKILSKHQGIKICSITSETNYSKTISEIIPEFSSFDLPILIKRSELDFNSIDVVFVALSSGDSKEFISKIINKSKIIDLSGDFRLQDINEMEKWYGKSEITNKGNNPFTYGLSEINRIKISKSSNVSVPGCYPTSILLPLIPLIKNSLISKDDIIIDSKSGYSGAGKKFNLDNLINDKFLNLYSYKTNNHRHIPEIEQELSLIANRKINIFFNPHILPFERGIFTNIYCKIENGNNSNKIENFLEEFYKNDSFIKIEKDKDISIFDVIHTNLCLIKVIKKQTKNRILLQCVIDNLVKGASGQAVQNMNIMMNFPENQSLEFII
ncbi:MAG: N-acetyl-gamma-glutamyl-phosphate reductase [Alphaproteobacteria bacterium MarineAlpha5_Bin11]|nr:N-acetyl-gamma-glutamyl-phosphate reductase [Pelagibacteraceae bacterium]PPR44084.1 MAG: N-acetyl-gamma-glutamyl-phosphate reductase [Alphaproteobacteria bacterium MarineAlpha5_Bin11]|tara:strand:- start:515 stop:1546 length:1032 start_codon:yes stop_codon:yes gene_type:complete